MMSPASAWALQSGARSNICLDYLGLVKHSFLFCLHSSRNWVPMSWNLVLSPEVLTSCCFLAAARMELWPLSGLMSGRLAMRLSHCPSSLALLQGASKQGHTSWWVHSLLLQEHFMPSIRASLNRCSPGPRSLLQKEINGGIRAV